MAYNDTTWANGDGLNIKFDVNQAEMIGSGWYPGTDGKMVCDLEFDLDQLTGDGTTILSYNLKSKTDMYLESATMVVGTAAAGGTSITVGLNDTNGVNVIDADGLITTTATAAMTEGARITGNGGALVGTKFTDNGVFTVTTVGTFTAGKVHVKLVGEVL